MDLSEPHRLTRILLVMTGLNLVVWVAMRNAPMPSTEDVLPPMPPIIRGVDGQEVPAPNHTQDMAVLDRILAARITEEASRRGLAPSSLLPSDALRAQAAASGDPRSPETRALVDAYQAALEQLTDGGRK